MGRIKMTDNLMHLNLEVIPSRLDLEFRNIIHATSLKNAENILRSGEIYGEKYNSSPLHANFNVSLYKKFALAKHTEVLMHFLWHGEQFASACHMVGRKGDSSYANTLFHVYASNDGEYFDFHNNYWQSIIFPGSDQLTFSKITLLNDNRKCSLKSYWLYPRISRLNQFYDNKIVRVV